MDVIIGDEEDLAQELARRLCKLIHDRSSSARIGLATGHSPRLTYELLSNLHQDGHINLHLPRWTMLDEFIGLSENDTRRFENELLAVLFRGMDRERVHLTVPPSNETSLEHDLPTFAEFVAKHPADLQILGIGRNGHIAFNEPGSSFDSRTRIVELSEMTKQTMIDNGWSAADIPNRAVSQGLADISAAREIVLLALGQSKFDALTSAFREPPSTECPASILQNHPRVSVLITTDLAKALR